MTPEMARGWRTMLQGLTRRIVVPILIAWTAQAAMAQTAPSPATPAQALDPQAKELIVGTKEAPPFAMKGTDGTWQGISIDLWRRIADEKGWRYRFAEEPTVQDLVDGMAAGKFDAAVAALTVTGRANAFSISPPCSIRPALGSPFWTADRQAGGPS